MKDKKITVEKVGKVPGKLGGLSLNDDFVDEIKEYLETVPSLIGARGPHGASGEQGRRGRRGLKGETGAVGVDGDHGVDGKTGDEGVQGKDGVIGLTGRQGVGAEGPKGVKGDKGDKGEPGEKGKQGRTGPGGGRGGAGRSAATTDFSSISLVGTDLVFARDKAGPLGPDITVDLSTLGGQAGFVGLGPWRSRTEIVSPPASGQLRFDNADPELATELFLHETNNNGEDLANFLALLEAGDLIYIQVANDSSKFILCEISSNTDSGVFVTLGLANVAQQGGAIAQNETVNVIATIAGGGGASVVNAAVQARRTTTFTLTTAFVDVTLDATDVETDAAIIEHDNVNTDDIDIKVTGTYEITYEADILTNAISNSTINGEGRVRLNNAGTGINGSLALSCAFRDNNITGNDFNSHLSVTFIANLTAGDFITLQLQKTEIGGSDVFVADRIHFQAKRIATIAGGGGGNVTKVDTPVDN